MSQVDSALLAVLEANGDPQALLQFAAEPNLADPLL